VVLFIRSVTCEIRRTWVIGRADELRLRPLTRFATCLGRFEYTASDRFTKKKKIPRKKKKKKIKKKKKKKKKRKIEKKKEKIT